MFQLLQRWLARKQVKAIRILKEQNVFDPTTGKPTIDRYYYHQWQQLTGEYIQHFLGKDSAFYKDFTEIKLLQVPIEAKPTEKELALEQWELQRANTTLMNCIIYISKFKYLYRKPSLFGLLPVTGQISIAVASLMLFFYIGKFTVSEKITFESEYRQCKETNEILKHLNDSLILVTNRPHETPNDSTNNQPDK